MSERINKTSICSVVFLDIIDYSKKSVSEQIDDKNCFNALISEAIKDVAQNDRIILDTGDGAAIALLGAPEEALFISLTIRDGILKHNNQSSQPLFVRIGINLGPVRVVSDINGQPNIIGDGINVAQRVMSFSEANQILVSRSYFEVTSRLTKEITQMFYYSGIKHDKHVREHEVYAIRSTTEEPMQVPSGQMAESSVAKATDEEPRGLLWYVVAGVTLVAITGIFLTLGEMHKPKSEFSSTQPKAATVAPPASAPVVIPAPAPVTTTAKPAQTATVSADSAPKKKPANRSKPKSDATADQSAAKPAEAKSESAPASSNHPHDATGVAKSGSQHKDNAEQKSAWTSFKDSIKQGAEKKTCSQAEIALGQCH